MVVDADRSSLLCLQLGSRSSGSLDSLPLGKAGKGGKLEVVVMLPRPVRQLAIASEDRSTPPAITRFSMRRLSRRDAMLRMLLALRTPQGRFDWRSAWRTLLDLVGDFWRGEPDAPDLLAARYRNVLRPSAPTASATLSRSWLRRRALELQPLSQLEFVAAADGSSTWLAMGEDPWFRLGRDGAVARLPAGWYRLRISIDRDGGVLTGPCLYPDFGDGSMQGDLISLPDPDKDGNIDVLVMFKKRVRTLRFDPSVKRGRFGLHRFELKRVGRCAALLQMFTGLHLLDGRIDLRGVTDDVIRFARTAWAGGLSVAANELFSRYSRKLQGRCSDYADWVVRYDSLGIRELEAMRMRASQLGDGPLVSLLVPVYETPERWLRECLDSVLNQVYPHWELCVVDDASPSERVRELLREYERRDPRIRVACRSRNGHISKASNTALALATGEFVALLDHDDVLRPHALLEMVEAVVARPELQLLYSDEDKIDEEGRRVQPNFKPDWNPDLLLSQNYVCHLTMVRTALARAVGGFHEGFEGSQDHDLVLRCSERLQPRQIHHVPKVLYHWRAVAGSTALDRNAKDYASAAGARAVDEHLQRTGANAKATELAHGHYRVRWRIPEPAPKATLIVPTRDKVELLRNCIESVLQRTRYQEYEIVVVDNQSSDPEALDYIDELRSRERIRVLRYDAAFNYSAINNWAVENSDGELLCLLNNDIEVISEDWLTEMAGHALREDIGAVGAMLYYPDDRIQHAGVILGVGGVANHAYAGQRRGHPGHGARAKVAQNLSAVTGACLVVRRCVYNQVGGFDERLQVAFNDIDFCLRLREAGYRNVWTPFAELYHHESASRGVDTAPENAERFLGEVRYMEERWGAWLKRDPAYNPNLSLDDPNFNLAFPPRDTAI